MHTVSIERWVHDHAFGQHHQRPGERRTLVVVGITAIMMAVEVTAGLAYGSMALLADGLHMASHASALTISVLAYYYTRRHARDPRFNFGTGKINSLAAFFSAVLLAAFAFIMAWESAQRLLTPAEIKFNQAILVAVVGLAVNGGCLFILRERDDERLSQDHNLTSVYLHVLADALTSVLAIFALGAGKYFRVIWLDSLMGVLGAVLVARWSWSLMRSTSRVLLDMQAPARVGQAIRGSIEKQNGDRVTDLHVWAVGPDIYNAEIAIVTSTPKDPDHYLGLLPNHPHLVHVTVEVRRCPT